MLKSSKGITLVALIVTIIVLLILAGVTISIVVNQNILDKSENAVDKYKAAEENEAAIFEDFEQRLTQLESKYDKTTKTVTP